ncbi:MAG: 2-C-methyl-D-erythritol 4-phosphate cytidylyltransferase [Acetatifactor sp.]|nr:2-C-methyl-D-erythritol 4-phosphate cytidylyltransferase [Acetatifactor sp.]
MATALIFAGGTGQRLNDRGKPKQFLEIHGKPIIIYTLEHFENHPDIDSIVVVCLKGWIRELQREIKTYDIKKVDIIVPGGNTGHDSIYFGLKAMEGKYPDDEIVLIHDGVRPLITDELITANIKAVEEFGTAITAEMAKESVILSDNGVDIDKVPLRTHVYVSKAPQSFRYAWIKKYYEKAQADNFKAIDSSHMLSEYGVPMHMVQSTKNNIKITDPADYYVVKGLFEAIDNEQIFGLQ